MNWNDWIQLNLRALERGHRITVPPQLHPIHSPGFRRLELAEAHGQVRDWVLSLLDGSRIHVSEFPSGSLVAHRDAWDPADGPGPAVLHLLLETRAGLIAGGLGAAAALVGGITYAIKRTRR